MDFDLRQLRHAKALAEHRSYAKAATALGLSQPALSRSVLELERRLGLTLFRRGRDGVDPTDAGRVLLLKAESLLLDATSLHRQLRELRGLDVGRLRVGAGTYPSEMFVAAAVARMIAGHPGVSIEVRTRCVDEVFVGLRRGEIGLGVTEAPWAEQQSDLHVQRLAWHRGVAAVRPGHPLATAASVSWGDVLAYPIAISPRVPPDILAAMRSVAERVDEPNLVGCDTPAVMRIVAERSDAVAIFPRCVVARELAERRLVALPVDAPWFGRAFAIVRLASHAPTPAEERFARLLEDADREAAELSASLA